MAPWLLIGGAVVGVVALGLVIYSVMSSESEEPYHVGSGRGGGYKLQQPSPQLPVEYSEIRRRIRRTCRAECGKSANAECKPCGHHEFCQEHAKDYMLLGEDNELPARCPHPQCRKVIKYFVYET